jgi:hypothetical protein
MGWEAYNNPFRQLKEAEVQRAVPRLDWAEREVKVVVVVEQGGVTCSKVGRAAVRGTQGVSLSGQHTAASAAAASRWEGTSPAAVRGLTADCMGAHHPGCPPRICLHARPIAELSDSRGHPHSTCPLATSQWPWAGRRGGKLGSRGEAPACVLQSSQPNDPQASRSSFFPWFKREISAAATTAD